jgi:hypothetical protein
MGPIIIVIVQCFLITSLSLIAIKNPEASTIALCIALTSTISYFSGVIVEKFH